MKLNRKTTAQAVIQKRKEHERIVEVELIQAPVVDTNEKYYTRYQTERGEIKTFAGFMLSPPKTCKKVMCFEGKRWADLAVCKYYCDYQCIKWDLLCEAKKKGRISR